MIIEKNRQLYSFCFRRSIRIHASKDESEEEKDIEKKLLSTTTELEQLRIKLQDGIGIELDKTIETLTNLNNKKIMSKKILPNFEQTKNNTSHFTVIFDGPSFVFYYYLRFFYLKKASKIWTIFNFIN